METPFALKNGVAIKQAHGGPVIHFTDDEYRELMAGEERYLMTEANTMADLEATFFYDSPLYWESEQIMEAITTSRLQLARTMKAFVRALSQKLNGTNLQAGSTATGGPSQDGTSVIGGADVGRARNINGLPVLPAIIPISDGQTVSILFHSPTADGKIAQDDTLVAFQFLLNKKDVTHTVAPIGGQDLTLAQVTMKLANLLEKNTSKFQRAQKKQKALIDEINQLQTDSDNKEDALHAASDQADAAREQADTLQKQLNGIISQAEALESENHGLQEQIDTIISAGVRNVQTPEEPASKPATSPPEKPEPGTEATIQAPVQEASPPVITDRLASVRQGMHLDGQVTLSDGAVMKQFIQKGEGIITLSAPDGSEYQLQAESMQGGKMDIAVGALFKAYRLGKASKFKMAPGLTPPPLAAENTPEAVPEPSSPNAEEINDQSIFWYGMRLRTGGPADPEYRGVGMISADEAKKLPAFIKKGFSADDVRHGAIGYRVELPPSVVADYELVDLKRSETASSAVDTLKQAISGAVYKWSGNAKTFARLLATGDAEVYDNISGYDKASITALLKKAGFLSNAAAAESFYALIDEIKASVPADIAKPERVDITEIEPEGNSVSDADKQANLAIGFLQSINEFSSQDLDEINAMIVKVQEAAQALTDAGVYEENEGLVNDAADHLIGLLVAVQQEGAG